MLNESDKVLHYSFYSKKTPYLYSLFMSYYIITNIILIVIFFYVYEDAL